MGNFALLLGVQFSCVLEVSSSLWPNVSASVRQLLAGLSYTTEASPWSRRGSREPLRSWLGAWGWLQPLESLSEAGGGASVSEWEGPLDWTGSTSFTRDEWEPSTGPELRLTKPGEQKVELLKP